MVILLISLQALLKVEDQQSTTKDTILSQVQNIFGHLLESQTQFFKPEGFWKTFKLWGEPVSEKFILQCLRILTLSLSGMFYPSHYYLATKYSKRLAKLNCIYRISTNIKVFTYVCLSYLPEFCTVNKNANGRGRGILGS